MPSQLLTRSKLRSVLLALFSLVAVSPALAADRTWTGADVDDSLWTSADNWFGGIAPMNNVDALIFGGANRLNNQNNFAAGATFKGIAFNGGSGAFTLGGNSLNLGVQITGTGITHSSDIVNNSASTQTISLPLTLNAGKHVITTGAAGINLTGSLTRNAGANVIFNPGAGAINVAGTGLTTSNGILGGWATIGGDWATLDGSNNVVPYSNYTPAFPGGVITSNAVSNIKIGTGGAAISISSGTTTINSLLYSGSATTAAQTVTVGAGNRLVLGQNGGIFNTTGISGGSTSRALTIGLGTLTAGNGINPATITVSAAPFYTTTSNITISSQITDNNNVPVSVVLMGGYATFLNNIANQTNGLNNTYSGGTYIISGRISQPVGGTFGTGPVFIFPGGQINPGGGANVTIPNNISIAGNGTFENNGLGAIRMFQNNVNFSTLLTGTLTLMDDASISSNGLTLANITANRRVGVVGKITGPGSLGIGSPTTNSANGTGWLEIGAFTGPAVANDYAGDTIINGALGGAAGAALRISMPTASNIMPHGLTGSFSGGATGNVVLNATTAARSATFDLNGSTQTINGLTNTSTSVANNIVASSTAGGLLILGDSNATASFGGIVRDVPDPVNFPGPGTLALTKIGTGVQTLSGANTYSGATNIDNGALSITGQLLNVANGGATNGAVNVNTSLSSAGALYGGGDGVITGVVGSVTLAAANGANNAVINPGAAGPGSVGALGVASLSVGAGSDLRFDAFGAGSSDQIIVAGNANFTGASTISPSATVAGAYTLLTAASINGSPTIGAGDSRLTYVALNTLTTIGVTASGTVANVTWTGSGNGTTWDMHNTANWTSAAPTNPNLFYAGDNVTFNDSPNANLTVVGTVTPGSVTFNNAGGNYVISGGSIGGPGVLTKGNHGTVTLTANNTYSGGTVLNQGTLNVNSARALGSGALTLAGGALGNTSGRAVTVASNPAQTWSGDFFYVGPDDLNLGTGAVTQTNLAASANRTVNVFAGTLTVGGIIADGVNLGNGLVKAGAGTLALNGVNTFSGPVTVSAGTLKVGNFGALGASAAGHTVAAGGTLDVGGFTTMNAAGGFTAPVTISGDGVNGQGALVSTGLFGQQNAFQTINLAAAASIGGDGRGTPGAPNFIGRFDLRGGAALLNLNGFTLTKTGTNEVRLAAATVNQGNIVVKQGVLTLEGNTSVANNNDGTNITVNPNATLQLLTPTPGAIARPIVLNSGIINDASTTATSLDSNITLQTKGTFDGPNASNLTLNGVVSGTAASLVKTGVSTLTLSNAANTYSGGTDINGGTVAFAALGSLGGGNLRFNGGTLQYISSTEDVSSLGITLNSLGGTIDTNSNIVTLAGNMTGVGGLTLRGNTTVTVSGTNTYAGRTTIQSNATVVLGSGGALPNNTALVLDSTAASPILDLNGRNIVVSGLSTIGNGGQIGNSSTTTPASITFNGGPTPSTFASPITDAAPSGGTQTTALTVNSGTLTLAGSNSYTGKTRINGGTLSLATNGSGTIAGASQLELNGGKFGTGGQTIMFSNPLTLLSSSTIDFGATGGGTLQFAPSQAQSWSGTLTISNWSPVFGDMLHVNNSAGLTTGQLASIKFDGFPMGATFSLGNPGEVVPSGVGYLRGDFNRDTVFDPLDIQAMLKALNNLSTYKTDKDLTDGDLVVIGDFNNTNSVTNADIQGLLNALAALNLGSVAAVPEPSAAVLAGVALASAVFVRRRRRGKIA